MKRRGFLGLFGKGAVVAPDTALTSALPVLQKPNEPEAKLADDYQAILNDFDRLGLKDPQFYSRNFKHPRECNPCNVTKEHVGLGMVHNPPQEEEESGEIDWDQHRWSGGPSVSCIFTPRATWRGNPMKSQLIPLMGEEMFLVSSWRCQDDEKYPGEFALEGADDRTRAMLREAEVTWIASGDVTPLEPYIHIKRNR